MPLLSASASSPNQHHAGRDVGVAQQLQRDEAIVGGGLRVVEDGAQLLQVPRPEQVADVADRREGQLLQRRRLDLQDRPAADRHGPHVILGQQSVRRRVVAELEDRLVAERHGASVASATARVQRARRRPTTGRTTARLPVRCAP